MLQISRLLSFAYLLVALLVTVVTFIIGPLGPAPFQVRSIGAASGPVVVDLAYSTEKKAWLEDAVARFAATNPRVRGREIQINLRGLGSREMVSQIVSQGYQPTVVSPASMIQIEQLRDEWELRNNAPIFYTDTNAPQPLVLTPLVFVAWRERGDILFPGNQETFWKDFYTVVSAPKGWAAFNQPETWGQVKFGQTSPETSNSGLQTLLLLAYGYYNKDSGLSAADLKKKEKSERKS